MEIADAQPADGPFLELMWHHAAFWQPDVFVMSVTAAKRVPEIARYLPDLGRTDDVTLVARDGERRLGAAWYHTFPADAPGYGFVDDDIPELSIGVADAMRGRGVGTALLRCLIDRARAVGRPAVSLSVSHENPAMRLYERLGFDLVGDDGDSFTMVHRFHTS